MKTTNNNNVACIKAMREETGKDQYEVVVKLKAIWLELSVLVCVA